MTVTYEEIKPYIDAGAATAAEILAAMLADPRTKEPIPLDRATDTMNKRKLWYKRSAPSQIGEKFDGSIMNMKTTVDTTLPEDHPVREAMRIWYSHTTNPRMSFLDTTDLQFATALHALFGAYADGEDGNGKPFPSSDDFAAIVALGGGYIHADRDDLTEATIQGVLDKKAVQDHREALAGLVKTAIDQEAAKRDATVQPFDDALAAAQAIFRQAQSAHADLIRPHDRRLAKAKSWISEVRDNAANYTVEEAQQRIAAIQASEDGRPPGAETDEPVIQDLI